MTTLSPEQLLGALNWRYATKKFNAAATIPTDLWKTLESALVLAPSSFGLQPWKFVGGYKWLKGTALEGHTHCRQCTEQLGQRCRPGSAL